MIYVDKKTFTVDGEEKTFYHFRGEDELYSGYSEMSDEIQRRTGIKVLPHRSGWILAIDGKYCGQRQHITNDIQKALTYTAKHNALRGAIFKYNLKKIISAYAKEFYQNAV